VEATHVLFCEEEARTFLAISERSDGRGGDFELESGRTVELVEDLIGAAPVLRDDSGRAWRAQPYRGR
jgi:hypothetical protein